MGGEGLLQALEATLFGRFDELMGESRGGAEADLAPVPAGARASGVAQSLIARKALSGHDW